MAAESPLWRRDVFSWALYDFANTIFSMNVVSLYTKRYLVEDLGYRDHYFDLTYAGSMAMAAVVLPALGALSDIGRHRKLFLLITTMLCCTATLVMGFASASMVLLLLACFALANLTYEAGMPFYNSLLYSVADGDRARFVSGFGVSLGYVGSIVGMIIVLPFVAGDAFGVVVPGIEGAGKQGAFVPTALLFLLFALPLFLFVREVGPARPGALSIRQAYREVWQALRNRERYPHVLRFLIADYFVEDAVATVTINIGLYCSVVLAMTDGQITMFLIVSTVSAVLGSLLIGKLAQIWSLRNLIRIIMGGWALCLTTIVITDNQSLIWVLGSTVGVLMGGLWTTTRPMLAEMVPRDELGRFYGLFALSGRAAAVIGPLVWTAVVAIFQAERPGGRLLGELIPGIDPKAAPYKVAVLALAALVLTGLVIFRKVPHTRHPQHG